MSKRMGGFWIVLALSGAGMVGCAGSSEPVVGGSSESLIFEESAPLEELDEESWDDAFAGCEGLLDGGEHFAVASAEAGLVAAIDEQGHVLCVDTVEAVEEELDEAGREEDADELVDSFYATISAANREGTGASRFERPAHEGDPDPEPNADWSRFRFAGDPDPEPNCDS